MTRLLSSAHALNGAMIVLLLLTLFHAAILLGFAPSDVVWGGRIENPARRYVSEAIALVVNVLTLAILAMKAKRLPIAAPEKTLNALIWAMAIFFALNALDNALSLSDVERYVFAPLALLLAIWRVAIARAKF